MTLQCCLCWARRRISKSGWAAGSRQRYHVREFDETRRSILNWKPCVDVKCKRWVLALDGVTLFVGHFPCVQMSLSDNSSLQNLLSLLSTTIYRSLESVSELSFLLILHNISWKLISDEVCEKIRSTVGRGLWPINFLLLVLRVETWIGRKHEDATLCWLASHTLKRRIESLAFATLLQNLLVSSLHELCVWRTPSRV